MPRDLGEVADTMFQALRGYVARGVAGVTARLDALEARIAALPAPKDGKDADVEAVAAVVLRAIPLPKDGVSPDPADVARLVPVAEVDLDDVAKRAAVLVPKAKDGEPGRDADDAAIAERVLAGIKVPEVDVDAVALAASKLVVVEPGRKGDPGESPALHDVVKAVLEALPEPRVPKDGRDADPVEVARALAPLMPVPKDPPHINDVVKRVRELIPTPQNGKDADPVDVDAIVEAVRALIPAPKDGVSPDPEAIARRAAELVPQPEVVHGRDADPVDVEAIVRDVLALIRQPEDGKSVDKQEIVREVIEVVLRELPPQQEPRDGADGRDALDINILPEIDTAKSYPRGTFASHDGGVWRAFEKTAGMRGWDCVVVGTKSVTFVQDETNARVVRARSVLSNGETADATIVIPMPVYCGQFKGGAEYEQGDMVTYGGSTWHCNAATVERPPGTAWTMAVRKGSDGKDGDPGKPGLKGDKGKDWDGK